MSLTSLSDVYTSSQSTEAAMEALYRCSVLTRTKICNGCNRSMKLVKSDNKKFKINGGWAYKCRTCSQRYRSIRSETVFDQTKKDLGCYVKLMWCFAVGDLQVRVSKLT